MTLGRVIMVVHVSSNSWRNDDLDLLQPTYKMFSESRRVTYPTPGEPLNRTRSLTKTAMTRWPTRKRTETTTDNTWSWVLPKKGSIRGRSTLPLLKSTWENTVQWYPCHWHEEANHAAKPQHASSPGITRYLTWRRQCVYQECTIHCLH